MVVVRVTGVVVTEVVSIGMSVLIRLGGGTDVSNGLVVAVTFVVVVVVLTGALVTVFVVVVTVCLVTVCT